MHRQRFIPAQNSRHRIAALSLYRALLRSADKIVLPKDVEAQRSRNAIQHVIRSRFVKDRSLASSRLVYASMAAGYKFLSLFSKAHDLTSPQYAQVISHLRRSRPPQLVLPRRDLIPPPPKAPAQEPFLVNISKNDSPHYVPTYTLSSKKHTLNLCATADGVPFLRLKKPQPPRLSKMVGRKGRLFQKKMMRFLEVDEDLKQDAALEDQWDGLIAAQMSREGLSVEEEHAAEGSRSSTTSFSWSVQLSRLWWEWQLEKTWQDWVARGEALNRFVEEQREAAIESPSSSRGQITTTQRGKKPMEQRYGDRPNVGISSITPFPHVEAINARLRRVNVAAPTKEADPFTGPRWNALVQSEKMRMLKEITRESLYSDQHTKHRSY